MITRQDMQKAQDAVDKAAKARRAVALAMFKTGKKYKEIGEELGVTRERARQLVAKAQQEAAPQG